jgi:hypothetical protein
MKFVFKSEQYGTIVEMSFEVVTLSEIEEMYKQFLRGSGFYLVEDEDNVSTKQQNVDTSEEWVHEVDMAYQPGGLTVEQAEKQEPVAWLVRDYVDGFRYVSSTENPSGTIAGLSEPLYTAPPKREWVGLTDEEIAQTVGSPLDEVYLADFRRVIAKLKERNT